MPATGTSSLTGKRSARVYLLDTNTCIYWLEGRSEALAARLRQEDPANVHIPSIAIAELWYGVAKSGRPDANGVRLQAFLNGLGTVPFDERAARYFGEVRFQLESAGKPIGTMDLLIAATALVHDGTVVTHNTGEFSRVRGLQIEDWTIPEAPSQAR